MDKENKDYLRIRINGKRVKVHRYVWEQVNGKIPNGYLIHHINGDKHDNRIENLQMMTKAEHMKIHHTGNKHYAGHQHSDEYKQKMSELMKGEKRALGYKQSKEHIAKRFASKKQGMNNVQKENDNA